VVELQGPVRAGDLDIRIRIDEATEPFPLGASGEPEPAYQPAYECDAQRLDIEAEASEVVGAEQTVAKRRLRFKIRWPIGIVISPHERFRLIDLDDRDADGNGREYDIRTVKQIGRREGLDIVAEARGE
jgi:head-tail joining protein